MRKSLIVFSLILVALFVRFYNFENRVTFGPEQAISLETSAKMIKEKMSLLGIENVQRTTSTGHTIYSGVLFSYTLIPLLYLFNYDPLLITMFFGLLNVLTGVVFYYLVSKKFSYQVSIYSLFIFLFSSAMINHSMFIWILNYLPLVGIVSFYYLLEYFKKQSYGSIFILGLLSGVGFSLEYVYIFTAIFIFFVILYKSLRKVKSILLYIVGATIPNIPLIIFEFKHNFYHLFTLYQYTIDVLNGQAKAGFSFYHSLHLYPILYLILGLMLVKLIKNRIFSYSLLALYLVVNLVSSKIDFNKPVGMMDGLNMGDIKLTSELISERVENRYNVVTLYDFDTRANTLRYFLNYVYASRPESEIEYKNIDKLYALASIDYNFESESNPWELNVFKPYNVNKMSEIGDGYALYELTK